VTPHRIAIVNGYVLSMDPATGELESGSVLIEGDRIVAVERDLGEVDAETIDAAGGVIMPGFVAAGRSTPGSC
jgi:5-methylthioadenosine/S-adenosylhomocysteine deaminase